MRAKDQREKKCEHTSNDDQRRSRQQLRGFANEESCIFCSQASDKLHNCAMMGLRRL